MKTKPIDSTWTDEQWNAIATRNTSILVSAGAGSGKTAVLTERILELLKEGHSILDLIVLTFTNAAAKEMKERVKQKLEVAISNGYPELAQELEKIDLSNICTFDSFSLNLVKKYHYLLGIEDNVQIGDTIFINDLKKRCMENTFQEFYEKEEPLFLKFLDTFTVKDDTDIQKTLLKVANTLTSRIHIKTSLEESYQNINESFIEKQFLSYEQEIQTQKEFIGEELKQHLNTGYSQLLEEYLLNIQMIYDPILKEHEYDVYAPLVACFSLPSFPRSKKIDEEEKNQLKEEIGGLKKEIQKLKDLCVYSKKEDYIDEILKTKDTVLILKEILITYFHRLEQEKKNWNYYEFHDIGRFAIQILEEHESIRKEFQESIYEIMIDEYQDTNDIGTYFVSMIQNNNVYTVGDVKQSIYRFRNANPNIFMERFYQFQKNEGGTLITLSKNFRSRKEVVDGINLLFQAIMDELIGGVHYHNQEEMIFGNLSYETVKDKKTDYQMEVLDYEYQDTKEKETYRKEEIEAFIIGNDIKKRIERKEKINDHGNLREVTYSDFAILQDRKTSFDLYKKVFTYLQIPITI
ncbi:MAG: UvrD-helicase domain-containing protein, partial [Firmicutes bacterium]|nr:UvrD-helicase domain-containing protein [Bacillota bacterium]